ncbi:MAG TPA: peptidoglycan bridge formation glycyltransferase FemA/FemB family protein [Bacteroidales bacterium]|nr:peptidoglycan bridge formation glycyltransferase FemA/FemB family protein [Bacteroidales bacterium]HPT20363.1 peptidoglycan bridge formation glycyltransferase FemA/FemB family protein [Bacteroidales bacterium]
MLKEFRHKDIEEVFKTSIVQQTAYWSEVKKELGVRSIACNFKVRSSDIYDVPKKDYTIIGDILVIIKQIDNKYTMAYVPYGPEIEPLAQNQGTFLEELSECLRPYLPKNCILIRYDLSWESLWAKEDDFYDCKGYWIGPPDNKFQEFRFNHNTISWNFKKCLSNILPSNTIFLDLKKDLADIKMSMKPKTRYNIELSARKEVTVNIAGIENLDTWYRLYTETAARNGFYLHNIDYFRAVLTSRANNTQSPAEVFLLIAGIDKMPLSAMFLVLTGNRGTYLYGASASHHKNLMASYAVQWEAIKLAKAKGCTEYDMFGVSPNPDPSHPLFGLYRFKTGFGGELYHTMGCWDYPIMSDMYEYFTAVELKSQGFHLN